MMPAAATAVHPIAGRAGQAQSGLHHEGPADGVEDGHVGRADWPGGARSRPGPQSHGPRASRQSRRQPGRRRTSIFDWRGAGEHGDGTQHAEKDDVERPPSRGGTAGGDGAEGRERRRPRRGGLPALRPATVAGSAAAGRRRRDRGARRPGTRGFTSAARFACLHLPGQATSCATHARDGAAETDTRCIDKRRPPTAQWNRARDDAYMIDEGGWLGLDGGMTACDARVSEAVALGCWCCVAPESGSSRTGETGHRASVWPRPFYRDRTHELG